MTKCEWCKEFDEKNTMAIAGVGRYNVCDRCLNLYGNQDFDELNRVLKIDDGKM
ncbi:unnamed protein product [marine sediment metagenome]|uniref:Uncharacterized protein n=1 Tax=marine sediment metagenome TaxID=412755 RepID=X1LKJ2_9ZZZZ